MTKTSLEEYKGDETRVAVNELVRVLVGLITKEGDIVVASDSMSKLWRDLSLKRATQKWNMKYVDIARSPGVSVELVHNDGQIS